MENLPFYRTRKFWCFILPIPLFVSIYLFVTYAKGSGNSEISVNQLFNFFYLSTGSTIFTLLGAKVASQAGAIIGTVIYLLLMSILIHRIFKRRLVSVIYPAAVIFIYLSGIIASILFFSGF